MDAEICKRLLPLKNSFSNLDNDGGYQFINNEDFQNYCTSENCDDDTDKVNARCLYIFDEFFKNSDNFESVAKSNINIVEYIMIWLSYMLNRIKTQEKNSIELFYDTYIKDNDKYTDNIKYIVGYKGYKDLIDRNKYFLSMDMSIISKLYDAFNTLCDIYIDHDANKSNCVNYSEKANQFVETYKKIIIDHNIGENIRYFHVLINLLTDYDNLKKNCENIPSTPDITKIISEQHVCEVASSSSSIASKLIPILSILVAIPIFLGIAYKYSLFGFRKRSQKQHLRENLKK
ncbi:PIR protein [Plasmodium yoelii]|uniref:PIR protein n=2 Tax=Plasmodium yoelii TaxID=5861 RepID=A0AAF0B226_PLAYO|nr:PIR protein [Plasmodium yoelii]WBY55456.1 PIR protein [Plasmodium yoelii yoelii]CDS44796.1 YIR protein [Plasmodium yoelii]VTZ73550.1 PIR protein [Plasmodium yoelii]|eukprot:XP_022810689.1 PIR protein [Plasmodium yoelii]